jgi:hypothetical protein
MRPLDISTVIQDLILRISVNFLGITTILCLYFKGTSLEMFTDLYLFRNTYRCFTDAIVRHGIDFTVTLGEWIRWRYRWNKIDRELMTADPGWVHEELL